MQIDANLLEAIYQTALRPQNYDALMREWEARLDALVEEVPDDLPEEGPGTALDDGGDNFPYLRTSLKVMEALDQTLKAVSERSQSPVSAKLLVGETKEILWCNGRAQRLFDISHGATLDTLSMHPAARERVGAALSRLSSPAAYENGVPLVVQILPASGSAPLFMIANRIAQPGNPDVLLLEQADSGWSDATEACLRESFGLTESEIQVLFALCDGMTITQIAQTRGRQVSTLRTQVKTILRKTGLASQAQLIRLALSVAAHVDALRIEDRHVAESIGFHDLPDGRRVPFHDYGPGNGNPVLFIHGMLDGVGFLKDLERGLHARNLRIIAPERPCFGSAPRCGRLPHEMVGAVARDMISLLDHLGLGTVVVVGHMAGSVYAFGLAAQAPDRVGAVVNVAGGVPIKSISQFRSMSRRQRTIAYSARFVPRALPMLLHAGIRQIRFGGVREFVEALYETSDVDRRVFADPAAMAAIIDGVTFAVAQGYNGFEIDSYHVVRDWSVHVEGSTCPVHLVHGPHDPVVSFDSVVDFAARLGPRCTLHKVDGAGQTVIYARPDILLDRLSELWTARPDQPTPVSPARRSEGNQGASRDRA